MLKKDYWYVYVHCHGIAEEAHKGQKRYFSNEDYITHPRRVAAQVALRYDDPDVLAAALLHDVMEDTTMTSGDLLARGVRQSTINILLPLTHFEDQSYENYITQVINGGLIPIVIKQADICDNLSTIPLDRNKLVDRYVQALLSLSSAYSALMKELVS